MKSEREIEDKLDEIMKEPLHPGKRDYSHKLGFRNALLWVLEDER